MTLEARFLVVGKPVPKARPRFDRRSGRVFTPAKSRAYERRVAAAAYHASRWHDAGNGFVRRRDEPWPEPGDCAREAPRRGRSSPKCACAWCSSAVHVGFAIFLPDRRTRDIDNIEKSLLDGMNGVLFRDDRQVTSSTKTSTLSRSNPRVEIIVRLSTPNQGSLLSEEDVRALAVCPDCEGAGGFDVTLPSGAERSVTCGDCAGTGKLYANG